MGTLCAGGSLAICTSLVTYTHWQRRSVNRKDSLHVMTTIVLQNVRDDLSDDHTIL